MTDTDHHLLLITNDMNMAQSAQGTLLQLGYETAIVQTEEEASSVLASQPIDLIICERLMPGFNTFRFMEHVMFDPNYRNTPVIYLAPDGLTVEGEDLRADIELVLTRPLNPLRLVAAVATMLERGTIYTQVMREDPLTRVLNRTTIQAESERELARVQRYQLIGSLVFVDIDNFKTVNDRFGHAVGDETLKYLANLLKSNIRNVDMVGRYGGEEFILYLPETTRSGAITLANRLLHLCHTATDTPPGIQLSFSGGVVETPDDGTVFSELVARGDEAMYAAKAAGKGRVISWLELAAPAVERASRD